MTPTTTCLTTLPQRLTVPDDHPLLATLNKQQQAAALHGAGTCLCCAGPGSGKTAVLIRRAALLIEAGVDPACLLAVTFTNKAARELKTRLAGMVGAEAARKMTVGTFHSLCARWLRRDAPIIGRRRDFTIYDQADSDRVIAGLFKALDLDTKGGKVAAMRERISRWKNDLITPEQAERRINPLDPVDQRALQFYVEYERILKRNNAFDLIKPAASHRPERLYK